MTALLPALAVTSKIKEMQHAPASCERVRSLRLRRLFGRFHHIGIAQILGACTLSFSWSPTTLTSLFRHLPPRSLPSLRHPSAPAATPGSHRRGWPGDYPGRHGATLVKPVVRVGGTPRAEPADEGKRPQNLLGSCQDSFVYVVLATVRLRRSRAVRGVISW